MTMMEILIVVTIIVLLGSIVGFFSTKSAFQKTRDSTRKQDLQKLVRIFEDYYDSSQKYPLSKYPPDGNLAEADWGEPFEPYTNKLPKDPLHPTFQYYYMSGQNGEFFIIYAKLENTDDQDIILTGCQTGCGPRDANGRRAYNYMLASTNVGVLPGIPDQQTLITGDAIDGQGRPAPTIAASGGGTFLCAYNNCCRSNWCGGYAAPYGAYCSAHRRCKYDALYGEWVCPYDASCP